MALAVIVLAAGKGKRMRSALPKVLHPVGGQPMLQRVLDTARVLEPSQLIVVYGHGGQAVPDALGPTAVTWVEQTEQLGTGHAVQQAMPWVDPGNAVLVLYGDVPLVLPETLTPLTDLASGVGINLLTITLDEPSGYGRIIRMRDGSIARIVEEKDATHQERAVHEINTGILCAPAERLNAWLGRLDNANVQGEYYLTDCIAASVADGLPVAGLSATSPEEVLGINDKQQLARVERIFQRRQADDLLRRGVTLADPARLDVRGTVAIGQDVSIDANVILEGHVALGDGVTIGANCVIKDAQLANGAHVLPHSLIEAAVIGPAARIGPFARIRPDTELGPDVHIGNFVEVKKSRIAAGSKVNHLSYIGDTRIGKQVNVGAGTITCNYDGANKHVTDIGDDVFIGSDTQLVAPVSVGDGATIGAGSTITKDAPAGQLSLSRPKQVNVPNWTRPKKST